MIFRVLTGNNFVDNLISGVVAIFNKDHFIQISILARQIAKNKPLVLALNRDNNNMAVGRNPEMTAPRCCIGGGFTVATIVS